MNLTAISRGKQSGAHNLRLERIRALDERIAVLKDRLFWTGEAARDLERELVPLIKQRDAMVVHGQTPSGRW